MLLVMPLLLSMIHGHPATLLAETGFPLTRSFTRGKQFITQSGQGSNRSRKRPHTNRALPFVPTIAFVQASWYGTALDKQGANVNEALGLIETRGFVGAVEAADAMVKTANVVL